MAPPDPTNAADINKKIKEQLEASLKTQEDFNRAKERQIDLDRQAEEQAARALEFEEKMLVAQEKRATLQAESIELSTRRKTIKEDLYNNEEKLTKQKRAQLEEELSGIDRKQEANKRAIEATAAAEKAAEKRKDSAFAKERKLLDELNESKQEYNETTEEAMKKTDKLEKVISKFAGKFGPIGKVIGKVFEVKGNMRQMASFLGDLGETIGGPKGAKIAKQGMKLANVVQNISYRALGMAVAFALVVAKLGKMALEINNLSKGLGAATGFGDQFNGELLHMADAGMMAGIGFKESQEALLALTQGLSSFVPSAKRTNMEVGLTVARLEKLGVGAAASVKSIDHMQRAMGLSATAAANKTAQIARMGKTIGISGTKMIEQFNAASGRLAMFGKNNVKVFKSLAAAAKATGIEMQSLINISKKFDQFDTAADSAAQLNAVLGTNLSTLEMMNANDADRVMMIKQQVQASVGNFDSLDKFTKQYVAQAMGVASIDEAQRLLNMSTAEYTKYQQGQKESANIQKDLQETTESLVPLMQGLKLAFMQVFLAMSPVISGITSFMQFITPYLGYFAKGLAIVALGWALVNIQAITFAGVMTYLGWPLIVAAVMALVAGIGYLADEFTGLFDIFSMKINPPFIRVFHFLSEGLKTMMSPQRVVLGLLDKMIDKVGRFFLIVTGNADKIGSFMGATGDDPGNFDINAIANLDTTGIANGFGKIKSAVMELSNIKIDGFLAMRQDGSATSFAMGSESLIQNISEGKLIVDVKMPDFKMPDINVKVFIGDRELRDIVRTEVRSVVGVAG